MVHWSGISRLIIDSLFIAAAEEDARKAKISNNRTWNRVRCKEDIHPETESKKVRFYYFFNEFKVDELM